MLAQDIDFHQVFRISPTAMALLTADLTIIDANDEFLAAAGRPVADLVGRNFFEALPKMPYDYGDRNWTVLESALTSGKREELLLGRYDIEDPAVPGLFDERYWSLVVVPIRGAGGEVEALELSAREVTPIIAQYRAMQSRRADAS